MQEKSPKRPRRDRFYHFRASADEIEKIEQNARAVGMRANAYVRSLALSGGQLRIKNRVDESAVFELRRLGALLKSQYPKESNWTNEEKRKYWAGMQAVLEHAARLADGSEHVDGDD